MVEHVLVVRSSDGLILCQTFPPPPELESKMMKHLISTRATLPPSGLLPTTPNTIFYQTKSLMVIAITTNLPQGVLVIQEILKLEWPELVEIESIKRPFHLQKLEPRIWKLVKQFSRNLPLVSIPPILNVSIDSPKTNETKERFVVRRVSTYEWFCICLWIGMFFVDLEQIADKPWSMNMRTFFCVLNVLTAPIYLVLASSVYLRRDLGARGRFAVQMQTLLLICEILVEIITIHVVHVDGDTSLQWWARIFKEFSIPFPVLLWKFVHCQVVLINGYYRMARTSDGQGIIARPKTE